MTTNLSFELTKVILLSAIKDVAFWSIKISSVLIIMMIIVKNNPVNTVCNYINFLTITFLQWLTQTHMHREELWCVTHFTSAQISYHSHIFRAYWLCLMTFRWYKDSISRFLSAQDINETLAAIVAWRTTSKKEPVTYFECRAIV